MQNLVLHTTSNFELFPEIVDQFMLENSVTIDSRVMVNFPFSKMYSPKETIHPNTFVKNNMIRAFLHKEQVVRTLTDLDDFYFYQIPMSNYQDDTKTPTSTNTLTERLANLARNLGNKLFDKLNWNQKIFMAKTAGVIEFKKSIDINSVYSYVKSYEL